MVSIVGGNGGDSLNASPGAASSDDHFGAWTEEQESGTTTQSSCSGGSFTSSPEASNLLWSLVPGSGEQYHPAQQQMATMEELVEGFAKWEAFGWPAKQSRNESTGHFRPVVRHAKGLWSEQDNEEMPKEFGPCWTTMEQKQQQKEIKVN